MMRPALLIASLAAGSLAAGAGLGTGCQGEDAAAGKPTARVAGSPPTPVLIELFTSQGCSSCPPAEKLLPRLPGAADGIEVLPLAFHVDYWDGLGWRDPFSSPEWTARQRRYAAAVGGGRVYTPALVIQGAADVNGSDRDSALEAIRRAAAEAPLGRITATRTDGNGRVIVAVDASLGAGAARAEAWVALTESGLRTAVPRGENEGRTMSGDHVVRRLGRAVAVGRGRTARGQIELAVDPAWNRDRLGVVVFLQDPVSQRVLAAARIER